MRLFFFVLVALACEASAQYQDGDVRLVGSDRATEGEVEVYYNGQWGTVCDDEWDINDAQVVCLQLGFPSAREASGRGRFNDNNNLPIFLDNLECTGTESKLTECGSSGIGEHNCFHFEDAIAVCNEEITDPNIQIVSTDLPWSGRLEVAWNNMGIEQLGSMCAADFDLTDGKVACKQLGYYDVETIFTVSVTTPTTIMPLFEKIACLGTETDLMACPKRATVSKTCDPLEFAGVTCVPEITTPAIRLMDGTSTNEGRVDVFWEVDGIEQSAGICATEFGFEEAQVVCKELGFYDAARTFGTTTSTALTSLRLMEALTCGGTEESIFECPFTNLINRNCPTSEYAAVTCLTEPESVHSDGDVRLVGSTIPSEGKVEVFFNGEWGTVCDDEWDIFDAQVVCNQLGFPSASSALSGPSNNFFSDTSPIHLDDVRCTGMETKLSECPSSPVGTHNCFHIEDAGVVCNVEFVSSPTLSLSPNGLPWAGQVEITWNTMGIFQKGAICASDFDMLDAKVVCKQLGYLDVEYIYKQSADLTTKTLPLFEGIACTGEETDIRDCPSTSLVNRNCENLEVAGVVCIPDIVAPSLRLVDGDTEHSGKVEVVWQVDGIEQSAGICSTDFSLLEGRVVCQQLGYNDVIGVFGEIDPAPLTSLILFEDITCTGTETEIAQCQYTNLLNRNCPTEEYASVICRPGVPQDGDVRLIGGETIASGLVEVYFNGEWGTVCDDDYDIYDALVICHQLGFPSAQRAIPGDLFNSGPYGQGNPSQTIWLDDLQCVGNETRLSECPNRGIGINNCYHNEDVAVICNTGITSSTIRLVNGAEPYEGRVEVLWVHNGIESFGTICDDNWTIKEAKVICRQLGFFDARAAYGQAHFGPGNGMILLDDVACTGTETDIVQCAHSYWMDTNCVSAEDASVVCIPEEPVYVPGKIKLTGGSTISEGRVEIFYEEWGVVCDNGWDILDAQVVCHELGFPSAMRATYGSFFGTSTQEYWLSGIICKGSEKALDTCSNQGVGVHDCEARVEQAGVICNTGVSEVEVRLVNGSTPLEGRLEVEYDGVFGPVCDDSFDLNAADVVCRQLGFFKAATVMFGSRFGKADGFLLDDVVCAGTEDNIAKCAHNDWLVHNCEETETVGIECIAEDLGYNTWDVRLVGGTVPSEGNLEVYLDRMWTSVCTTMTITEAQVVCKQLGFPSAQFVAPPGAFPFNEEKIVKMNVKCTATETSIEQCNKTIAGMMNECDFVASTGIVCNTGVRDVPLRLVDGGIPSAGRLEVSYNGQFGTICDDYFSMENANVACRQLGFTGAKMLAPEAHFGEGTGPILLDNVRCVGTETNLAQCAHLAWGTHDCNHREDVGVICYKDYETIDIQLTGNFVRENEGLVVLTAEGSSGYICGDLFDKKDADVICRTMGYTSAVNGLKKPSNFTATILTDLECTGKETTVLDCDHSRWFDKTCTTNTIAFVTCKLPEEGDLRLKDGPTFLQGRVEVYHSGEWGTVCDDGFGTEEARVVCNELGLGAPVTSKTWPFGSVPFDTSIWLDDVECTADDIKLVQCSRNEFGVNDCSSIENVGVICTEEAPVKASLIDGPFDGMGTISLMSNKGESYLLCSSMFTMPNAMVLCSQMGYRGAAQIFSGNYFSTSEGTALMMDFTCTGNENTISACSGFEINLEKICPVKEAMSVVCLEDEPFQLHLTGGPTPAEGRVEIKYGGKFGTICDDMMKPESAKIICQSLGYGFVESFRSAQTDFTYDPDMPIWMDNVACRGTESAIELCPHNGFGEHNCFHNEDLVVKCTDIDPDTPDGATIPDGTFRLVNTTFLQDGLYIAGRLEVYFGTWGTVCDDSWDITDADMVCKQLGFTKAVTAYTAAAFGEGTGTIWIDDLTCPRGATMLKNCTYSLDMNDCRHSEDVAVACVMRDFDFPVRLVGGEWVEGEGRVEIEINGEWGTVCSENWDKLDATIVCKKLGFPGATGAVIASQFGPGTGPIFLTNVACAANDTSLAQCSHSGLGVNNSCTHEDDAGVVCFTDKKVNVTLKEGISPYDGRIELGIAGTNRSVCFDDFGVNEANVICRQLGYVGYVTVEGTPARSGVPIYSTKLRCSGLEIDAGSCRLEFLNTIRCQDELVATITCRPPQDGDIRLADGHMALAGRVEYFNGEWGTVCDDKWDIQDANVVCRQLGFSKAVRALSYASYGEGKGPIWLDEVNCRGGEKNIRSCGRNSIGDHNCVHSEDASVICEMSVRLIGGRTAREGRVEVLYNGEWGTVCSDGFDMPAADVVCRQVGFTRALDVTLFEPGSGAIVLDEVSCTGNEKQLVMCQHNGFSVHDCMHIHDIGVTCE